MPPARNAARAASPLRGRTAGNGPRKKASSTKKSRSADKPLPAGERLGVETARKEVEVAPAPPVLAMSADRTEEIEAAGGRATVHPGDVADRAVVERTARDVLHHHGRVDGLVNAAGFVHHGLVKDHPPADAARLVHVNLLGTLHFVQALLPALREGSGRWIVNVSSFAGLIPQPDEAVYSATKAAVTSLSAALGHEVAPLGVHVLAVQLARARPRRVVEQEAAGRDRRQVLRVGLGVHRHHHVHLTAAGQVSGFGDADLVPGGQALDVGREEVLAHHRHAHAEDRLGQQRVGARGPGAVRCGGDGDEAVEKLCGIGCFTAGDELDR